MNSFKLIKISLLCCVMLSFRQTKAEFSDTFSRGTLIAAGAIAANGGLFAIRGVLNDWKAKQYQELKDGLLAGSVVAIIVVNLILFRAAFCCDIH